MNARKSFRRQRGSALVMALLVVLILTVVALGVSYLTSSEDRFSGNSKMARVGFYAADAGLRAGEDALTQYSNTPGMSVTSLLTAASSADVFTPPGGGRPAYLLVVSTTRYEKRLAPKVAADPNTRGMYTLYVRNNPEDPGGDTTDTDGLLQLVSVGQMVLTGASDLPVLDSAGRPTIGITKVLEEQINTSQKGSAYATQKGTNVGGTGAGSK